MLEIEEVRQTVALDALRPEWSALWERCPAATPFQRPEWLLPWYARFGGANRLWVLVLRHADRLVGLAPLFVHFWRGRRQVSLLGTGITDSLDLLLDPEHARPGARALLAHLAAQRGSWELCDFEQLPAESPLLSAAAPPELLLSTVPHDVRLVVRLPATMEEYRARLSAKQRDHLRLARSRAKKAGALQFEIASAETLPEFFDALHRLHEARWNENGLPGVLATPELRAFYLEAAAGLLERDMLRLHALRANGTFAALLYTLVGHGRALCYLNGLNPALKSFSPGMLLLVHVIEESIQNGLREVDFLRGTEPYKYAWKPEERPNQRLLIRHSGSPPACWD